MKIMTILRRKCAWMNVSTVTLIALLQRTPVLRLAGAVDEMVAASPVGTILKSAAAAVAALGAVDTMAGATILASTLTADPTGPLPDFDATVGVPIKQLGFTITNTLNVGSWKISGQIPPGLDITAAEGGVTALTGSGGDLDATTPGTSDGWGTTAGNTHTTPVLEGTPTKAGTYTIMLQGFAGSAEMAGTVSTGSGISSVFSFTVVVATAAGSPTPTPMPSTAAPVFTTQPISVTVTGGTVALEAVASNSPTYQWYLNGPTAVAGATSSTLVLSDAASAAGSYTCVATNSSGTATSDPATVSLASTGDFGHLTNLSTRALVGTGTNILEVGFAVGGGAGDDPLLIRASGPSLAEVGLTTGTLTAPQLTLVNGPSTLATNSGWAGSATISSEASLVGAFPWNNPASLDSALATSLGAGTYSVEIAGADNGTGVALAEVYDATPSFSPASPRLTNLSARVLVGTGANVLFAGFAIGGSTSRTVLIRASGPVLAAFGLSGILPDPRLTLTSGGVTLAQNTGWGGDPQISSAASDVGAFPWGTSATPDSALLITLPPGAYSAEVAGASGDTGLALVEVYEVP